MYIVIIVLVVVVLPHKADGGVRGGRGSFANLANSFPRQ